MPAPSAIRLNQLLTAAGSQPLEPEAAEKFSAYLDLLQKWNARTNLTAIRDEEGILSRHFVESIQTAHKLPENIVSLLDFGSGAGFPGLPIALIRKDLVVTLAESQHKKAAFLREAVRALNLTTKVHSGRAEELSARYDCITLRAVDKMEAAIPAAIRLLSPHGSLIILTTEDDRETIQSLTARTEPLVWASSISLAAGTQRILLQGQKQPQRL